MKLSPEVLADIVRRLRVAEPRRRYELALEQPTVSGQVYDLTRDEVERSLRSGNLRKPATNHRSSDRQRAAGGDRKQPLTRHEGDQMGEAANNPRSQQYQGPMPDYLIDGRIKWQLLPTPEWIAANKDALEGPLPPTPTPDDCLISFDLVGSMAFPSRIIPQAKWPAESIPLMPLFQIPFVDFKKAIQQKIAGAQSPQAEPS